METALAIALIVGLALVFLLIRFLVYSAAHKAEDAIRNSVVRRREEKNPPRQQRLADRYSAPAGDRSRG